MALTSDAHDSDENWRTEDDVGRAEWCSRVGVGHEKWASPKIREEKGKTLVQRFVQLQPPACGLAAGFCPWAWTTNDLFRHDFAGGGPVRRVPRNS